MYYWLRLLLEELFPTRRGRIRKRRRKKRKIKRKDIKKAATNHGER